MRHVILVAFLAFSVVGCGDSSKPAPPAPPKTDGKSGKVNSGVAKIDRMD